MAPGCFRSELPCTSSRTHPELVRAQRLHIRGLQRQGVPQTQGSLSTRKCLRLCPIRTEPESTIQNNARTNQTSRFSILTPRRIKAHFHAEESPQRAFRLQPPSMVGKPKPGPPSGEAAQRNFPPKTDSFNPATVEPAKRRLVRIQSAPSIPGTFFSFATADEISGGTTIDEVVPVMNSHRQYG
jgi:hypothetical protein